MSVTGDLKLKIKSRTARVGVIGLGYVGLPLAVEFAEAGFQVVGIDLDAKCVKGVTQGQSHIEDIPSEQLAPLVKAKKLSATTDYAVLKKCDAIIICVPTPLRKTREPDISFILSATQSLVKYLKPGHIITLESTTYPGTTTEVILPLLEGTGLKAGKDFFLGFSPERIDPGNQGYTTATIPKVVSGVTPACCKMVVALYSKVIQQVVPVSSTEVAEMVKLLENTFRSVNIGLVNELALMCNCMGVDIWEVVQAAATKPFGFMPFYPGPGLGGHCIPVDPLYLSWKAKLHGFEARFIELASQINGAMPEYVVRRISELLNTKKLALNGAKILLLGVAYKANVSDMRESPALEILNLLLQSGANIRYHDPLVPAFEHGETRMRSVPLTQKQIHWADCVVVLADHSDVDYSQVSRQAKLIFDTRHVYGKKQRTLKKIASL